MIHSLAKRLPGLGRRRTSASVDPNSTHIDILNVCLESLNCPDQGPKLIYEFGCGDFSTQAIRRFVDGDDQYRLVTFESNLEWAERVGKSLGMSERHEWEMISESNSWHRALMRRQMSLRVRSDGSSLDIAFIDSSPWDSRTIALLATREIASLVVVHDVDYFPSHGLWGSQSSPIAPARDLSTGDFAFDASTVGARDYSDLFSSWVEFFPRGGPGPTGPPTLVGSNLQDLRKVLPPMPDHYAIWSTTDDSS